MIVVILAAIAMFVQDVLATLLVQAEARNKAWLSAILDSLMWGAGIATTTISVTAFQGHSFGHKVAIVMAVTTANVAGSFLGVIIGKRFIKEQDVKVPVET